MTTTFDLNAASPSQVPDVLRNAAQKYREDASELQACWQDDSAGRIWLALADTLDKAASMADATLQRDPVWRDPARKLETNARYSRAIERRSRG